MNCMGGRIFGEQKQKKCISVQYYLSFHHLNSGENSDQYVNRPSSKWQMAPISTILRNATNVTTVLIWWNERWYSTYGWEWWGLESWEKHFASILPLTISSNRFIVDLENKNGAPVERISINRLACIYCIVPSIVDWIGANAILVCILMLNDQFN